MISGTTTASTCRQRRMQRQQNPQRSRAYQLWRRMHRQNRRHPPLGGPSTCQLSCPAATDGAQPPARTAARLPHCTCLHQLGLGGHELFFGDGGDGLPAVRPDGAPAAREQKAASERWASRWPGRWEGSRSEAAGKIALQGKLKCMHGGRMSSAGTQQCNATPQTPTMQHPPRQRFGDHLDHHVVPIHAEHAPAAGRQTGRQARRQASRECNTLKWVLHCRSEGVPLARPQHLATSWGAWSRRQTQRHRQQA